MNYEKHPLNIYPEVKKDSDDYKELLESLSNGYDTNDPISLYEGKILDGWNRYLICKELDKTPTFRTINKSHLDALLWVKGKNARRNLTPDAKIMIFAKLSLMETEIVAEQERKKKISESMKGKPPNTAKKPNNDFFKSDEGVGTPTGLKNNASKKEVEDVGQPYPTSSNENRHATRSKLAKEAGVGEKKAQDAITTLKTKPELVEKIIAGETTFAEIKKEEKKQARKKHIENQIKDINEGKLPELKGLYDVISIDPPWPYGREYDPETSRVANPYPEMSIDEIRNIQLPLMENSVLLLWTTHMFLPDAFNLLKAWGLEYKATLVWNKDKMGMGAWFRMQCEFCLVAIKGKPYWDNTKHIDIITEKRREHSRKPDKFFDIINQITLGRKLEYFSREPRDGWDIYGNDTNKF
jgi:N6-adenosine-specific RNA methylase IME4